MESIKPHNYSPKLHFGCWNVIICKLTALTNICMLQTLELMKCSHITVSCMLQQARDLGMVCPYFTDMKTKALKTTQCHDAGLEFEPSISEHKSNISPSFLSSPSHCSILHPGWMSKSFPGYLGSVHILDMCMRGTQRPGLGQGQRVKRGWAQLAWGCGYWDGASGRSEVAGQCAVTWSGVGSQGEHTY